MKRALGLLAASVIVAAGLAWIVQGASEDANPEKHVRSLPVDTSGEAVNLATEATLDKLGAAVAGTTVATGTISGVSVGAATTEVLAAGTTRIKVLLTNDSDEAIYVAIGTAAVSNEGIRLSPLGGSATLDVAAGCRLAINAICASGSKTLCVQTLGS